MSEYHTMYHDGYAKAFFIETPGHERLAIFPYGRGQGDVSLDVAKEAASKALDCFNGQIIRLHPERYIMEKHGGLFYVLDTQKYETVSTWFVERAAQGEVKRLNDSWNAKQKGDEQ